MIDIELLKGYYSGSTVKIALVDDGASPSENIKKYTQHYSYNTKYGNIEKTNALEENSNSHASLCLQYLNSIAPRSSIIDICVQSESGTITEEAVCAGIDFAIAQKVDIINISLGFLFYSTALYEACKRAYDNNIIVVAAAARGNDLAFPADNNNVIKVIDDYESGEEITKISDSVYKVKYKVITEESFDEENNLHTSSVFGGSSIACAYFSAILSLYLESRPLVKRKIIIDQLYESIKPAEVLINSEDKSQFIIQNNSVVTVISDKYNLFNYVGMMNNNIVGIYNIIDKKINYINECTNEDINNLENINLIVVNPLQFDRIGLNNDRFKNVKYVGLFSNTESYTGKVLNVSEKPKVQNINTPIVLIAGVGTDCDKFSVQLELKRQFIQNGLAHHCITHNPLGCLFGMEYINVPQSMPMQDMVHSINSYIKDIEENIDGELESIIISVAGGMFPICRINTNNFGALYHAYLTAMSVDYILICTNCSIHPAIIQKEIEKLKLYGNVDIAIVISDISYHYTTSNHEGIVSYIEEESEIDKSIIKYKEYVSDIPIYKITDVKNGLLYKEIFYTEDIK